MSNYLYTVSKPFVFKGMSFKAGDSFDPEKVQCPAQRLRTLLSARLLVPGYAGAVEAPKRAKAPAKPKVQKKAPEPNKAPEGEPDASPDKTEAEKGKSNETSKQPGRRSGRRN